MSDIIETLLLRNLQEVFGDGDPTRRRAAIEKLYTEDCTVLLPRWCMNRPMVEEYPISLLWGVSAVGAVGRIQAQPLR